MRVSTACCLTVMMLPASIPDAPWILRGEAVVFLASPLAARLLVNYRESPVGPYREHALARMTARGPHVFQMSVDAEASKIGGRLIWGFPKTLEDLSWEARGNRIRFRREKQRFEVRKIGPSVPIALSFWTVQTLDNRQVRVPGKIRARLRLARRGRQIAFSIEDFWMQFDAPIPL